MATAQSATASVLRNLAAFPELHPSFRDEGALPLLLQLVSLSTPRAQELALGCLQNLTSGDGDECPRLKIEAFQEGALACVKDFLESSHGDEQGLASAFGLLRNMASFRRAPEVGSTAGRSSRVAGRWKGASCDGGVHAIGRGAARLRCSGVHVR